MNPFIRTFKQEGPIEFLRFTFTKILQKLRLVNDTRNVRLRLSTHLQSLHQGRVAYGPLKGFQFSPMSRWSKLDRGGMILGLYEQEVLAAIATHSEARTVFVDIGAADGYYSIGMVSQGLFEKSYSFERSNFGQKVIADTAAVNNVTDRTEIFGIATAESIKAHIPAQDLSAAVVLVDIEGGEFGFLSDEILDSFKSCVVLIELHEWFFDDGDAQRAALEARVKAHFDTEILHIGPRDLSQFPELQRYTDDERWLICSEGRARPMEWMLLTPRKES